MDARLPTEPTPESGPELTIVMPCLNEARTVATCVAKARDWLRRAGVDGEVVVADNGSRDGSQELAAAAGARVVAVARRGYGAALAAGIAAARGRFVIMGDADDSYDFAALDPFLARLRAGDELVIGNRFAGGIASGAMPPMHRYLGNPALTRIGRLLYGGAIGDVYCGLRGFRRDVVLDLRLRATGMEFALEMIVKALIHGRRIGEVPTTLRPDGRDRAPHLRTWRDGWRSLRFFLLLSPRALFLYPGLALLAAGLLLSCRLAWGDLRLGGVTLSYHTLIFTCAAVTIGWQMVFFWVLAKRVAIRSGLLRADAAFERLLDWLTIERSGSLGALLMLGGAGLALDALLGWYRAGFGSLDDLRLLRTVCLASTGLVLGAQVAFASFFLHLLAFAESEPTPAAPPISVADAASRARSSAPDP